MTEAWLVRHGETEWSRSGQHTGLTDLALTEAGEAAARLLRPKLAAQQFGLVLSSPLRRARDTARLAGFPDADVDADLVEWDYGPAEGLTTQQIQRLVPDWRIWTHGAPQVPGERAGETQEQLLTRLGRVCERVRASGADRVLLFGHGHALRVFTTIWCGFPIAAGAHFPLQTATVGVLGYEKTTPAIVRWNA